MVLDMKKAISKAIKIPETVIPEPNITKYLVICLIITGERDIRESTSWIASRKTIFIEIPAIVRPRNKNIRILLLKLISGDLILLKILFILYF
jgi:hypothetical protein